MSITIRGRLRAAHTGILAQVPHAPPSLTLTPAVSVAGGAFRLSVAATAPDGTADPAIFVHLVRPYVAGASSLLATFQKVATPVDLAALPAGAPWPDASPPRLRLAAFAADQRSRREVDRTWALVRGQVQGLLDDLAMMVVQAPGDPVVVGAGDRSLTLLPTAQLRGPDARSLGCRLTLTATAAVGLADPAIFLATARPDPAGSAAAYGAFAKVCAPADLAAYPEGAPAAGAPLPASYRVRAITLDFPDAASAAATRSLILADAQALMDALAAADAEAAYAPATVAGSWSPR